jgi:hypothetical protein
MDWNTPHLGSWPAKLVLGISAKVRSKKAYTQQAIDKANAKEAERRRKRTHPNQAKRGSNDQGELNELGERQYSAFDGDTLVDKTDHTDMMHRLAHHDSFDSLADQAGYDIRKLRDPYFDSKEEEARANQFNEKRELMVAVLPDEVWMRICSHLDAIDAASLSIATKTLNKKLGDGALKMMNLPENRNQRIKFLQAAYDKSWPGEMLCFPCASYHRRTSEGKESLHSQFQQRPIYNCPNVRNTVLPRTRITHGRELPYYFMQLALKESYYGSRFGITHEDLARQWKCKDSTWKHRTRYIVHDGHLLMRCVSTAFAPPELTVTAERHLLYDREEFTPFFSVCAHWRDGLLTKVCKCALSHVPKPPDPYKDQIRRGPKISREAAHPNFIVTGCDTCRPARRCPECPSEYLVEIQMCEDPNSEGFKFKHAIVVTRWADLGDGKNPYTSPEWLAINGLNKAAGGEEFQSFSRVGRRAVSGMFESRISGSIPGQRLASLNPKNERLGEEGDGWY